MRLGAHMSVSGGKHMALIAGRDIGCESIQVFIRNVRGWTSSPLKEKEIKEFHSTQEELKKEIWPIITHNSYLINLASQDPEKLEKSYNAMLDELIKADQLSLDYANMHPGVIPKENQDLSSKEAMNQITVQLNSLMEETKDSKVVILLETTAGQGKGLGHKFEHMKYMIDRIKDKKRIGVCFDTAHSFAAGYDFTTQKKYDELWNTFDSIIGLKYLKAFHLNDTDKECGSRVDRHAHIGKGKIGKDAFNFLVNDDKFKDLPGILETPEGDTMFEKNLKFLKGLRKQG
ncbi:MAG: deoxyribonuclease IV [Promethearchaeota archaeon]|nr:MAG: deoxyribonuclease IV [Candidatus Lokiarchaeota archaeon]